MRRAAGPAALIATTIALASCSYPNLTVEACTQGDRLGFRLTMPEGQPPQIDRVAVGKRQPGTSLLSHVAYTPTNFWNHNTHRSELIYYGQVPNGWHADAKAPALVEGAAYEVWITGGKSEGRAAFTYGSKLPACRSL